MSTWLSSDMIAGAELSEEYGEVRSVNRTLILQGVTHYQNMGHLLQKALNDDLVPECGDYLWLDDDEAGKCNLMLTKRTAKYLSHNGVTYEAAVQLDLYYEIVRTATDKQYPLSGSCSLETVETQKDKNGTPLTVTYKNDTKIATVNVPVAKGTTEREIIIQTETPDTVVDEWRNKVNDGVWQGKDAKQWLCVSVEYEPFILSTDTPWYRFKFVFESTEDDYTYTAVYKDQNGDIPTEATSVTVNWHDTKDYSTYFA